MYVLPFTDAHLYVCHCRAAALPLPCGSSTTGLWSFTAAVRQLYHRPVVDVRIFIEKRYGLGSSLIMTKLGTLRSQFMKSSVYKGEIPIYTERRFSFPEIRLYLHSTALLLHGKWVNIHDIRKIPTGNIRWPVKVTDNLFSDGMAQYIIEIFVERCDHECLAKFSFKKQFSYFLFA